MNLLKLMATVLTGVVVLGACVPDGTSTPEAKMDLTPVLEYADHNTSIECMEAAVATLNGKHIMVSAITRECARVLVMKVSIGELR